MPLTITTVGAITSIGDDIRVEETLQQERPNPLDPEGPPELFVEYRVYRLEEITDPIELANRTDPLIWALKSAHEVREDAVNAGLALVPEA